MSESNALAVQGQQGTAVAPVAVYATLDPTLEFIQNLAAFERVSVALARSGMVKDNRPEAVLAKMMRGHELGIPAMVAQGVIHFFDGKTVLDAHAQLGVAASRYGVRTKILKSDTKQCRLLFTRQGWEDVEEGFTWEEAQAANLAHKDNWKKYPKDMLYARAVTRGLKRICPDGFAGVYAPGEIEDVPAVLPNPIHVPAAAAPAAEPEQVEEARAVVLATDEQVAELRELADKLGSEARAWLDGEAQKGIPQNKVASIRKKLQKRIGAAVAAEPPASVVDPDADPLETLYGEMD